MTFRILLIFSLFIAQAAFGQNQLTLPLHPKGAIPEFLKFDHNIDVQYENMAMYLASNKSTKKGKDLYFKQLYQSGKILFGDELSAYCDNHLQSLILHFPGFFKQKKAYAIQSTHVGVFSDDERIYVTTALLAQLEDPYTLYFFLLKAGAHHQLKSNYPKKNFTKPSTVDDIVKLLTQYSTKQQIKGDSIAGMMFANCGFNTESMMQGLDVIQYGDLPYDDRHVPSSYFASSKMYVPLSFFEYRTKIDVPSTLNRNVDSVFNTRRKALVKIGQANNSKPLNIRADRAVFENIQRLARCQLAYDLVLNSHPERALYTIFLLEKDYGLKQEFQRLKSHAYLAFVAKEFRRTKFKRSFPYNSDRAPESLRFYGGLQRLNGYEAGAFSLRLTTDIIKAFPALKVEVSSIQNNIIDLMVNSGRFPIDQFSKYSIEEIRMYRGNKTVTGNKYDKILANEAEKLKAIDTVSFTLYAISDWMQNEQFVKRMTDGFISVPPAISKLNIQKLSVVHFKKKKVNTLKSGKRTKELTQMIAENGAEWNIECAQEKELSPMEQYQYQGLIHDIQLQHALLETNIHNLSTLRLQELKGTGSNAWAHVQFLNNYSLEPKGYHFLGLLVVPLPFVIPDLIVGGHTTQFSVLIVDPKTGLIVDRHQSISRNPAHALMNFGQLNQYLQNLN